MSDLKSRGWIIAKGLMFALIVLLAGAGNLLQEDLLARAGLLAICLWAACRFYYFLFHVLEHWVGVEGRYSGLWDLACRLRRQGRRPPA